MNTRLNDHLKIFMCHNFRIDSHRPKPFTHAFQAENIKQNNLLSEQINNQQNMQCNNAIPLLKFSISSGPKQYLQGCRGFIFYFLTTCDLLLFFDLIFIINIESIVRFMNNKLKEQEKWVYKFTKPTMMKFIPSKDFQSPSENKKPPIYDRIRNFFSPDKGKIESPKKKESVIEKPQSKINQKGQLKFIKKLTNQHILVGNQDQLDVLNISYIIQDFVDTQFQWSLSVKKAIESVSIDYKKSYILILADQQVQVYSFDHKLVSNKPVFIHSIQTKYEAKFVHAVRQSTFLTCSLEAIEIFTIDQVKGIKANGKIKLTLPHDKFKLFSVPQPFEEILNVFFQDCNHSQSYLRLWTIEVSCPQKDIKVSKAIKVYDVPSFQRNSIRIQNYSKNCFIVISGSEIIAFKNGYMIDPPEISIHSSNNYFRHLCQNKLIHISDTKAEIYNLTIDSNHPPKINIKDFDSIYIPKISDTFQFVDAVDIMNDNFVVIYQTKPESNKFVKGELIYCFIVTHLIKMEEKIKEILPHAIKGVEIGQIQEKADMVKRMGLSRKEIYLRLWNNSEKNSIQDFKILLDTLDYQVVKVQIQKKLKKNSMNFRQILLLQQGCLAMLHENINTPKTTKQDLKNYFISHYLIRKLQLYKQISMIQKASGKKISEDDEGKLLIDIQNYNYYKAMDIKGVLYEYIQRFAHDGKNQLPQIRAIFKHFLFSLRVDYQSILKQIISNNKKNLLKIFQNISQLLPINIDENDGQQEEGTQIFAGVWGNIAEQQWQKHVYIDAIESINNKDAVMELVSEVWYKRQWLTHHDYINLTRAEITKIHLQNCSQLTYYNVIEYIFDTIKEYSPLKTILGLIQDKYPRMPQHLYGKIFLYHKIYDHLKESSMRHNNKEYEVKKFGEFLRFKDQDIFKQLFMFEKIKKGFILKEIQTFYCKLASKQTFNEGLLNYLASTKSQVSDIKYLLNRLNNQKLQFLRQNQQIYQVLIRGMQVKLKIGSENDIPISQVLIYIQTIHLSQQTPAEKQTMLKVMKDLEVIALIEEYSPLFKKIKLNMSIFEITKNPDSVIAAVTNNSIDQSKILKLNNLEDLMSQSKEILTKVIDIKDNLYSEDSFKELPIYCYLIKLLQEPTMIPNIAHLLQDQWINNNQHFTLTQKLVENAIIYVYKWYMSKHTSYTESRPFIKDLISLLPLQNKFRSYVQAEIQFTQILQAEKDILEYPLCNDKEQFNTVELQNTISRIPGKFLLTINIQRLYKCALSMQEIGSDNKVSEISLHGVYQAVVLRLIECELYKQVITIIRQLNKVQADKPFNFIYPAIIISKLAPELIQENRYILLKCLSFLFSSPDRLLDILDSLMRSKSTNFEYKEILLKHYTQIRHQFVPYNTKCPLLEDRYFFLFQEDPQLKLNYNYLLRHTLIKMIMSKQEFAKPSFYIMYVLLCNDPYTLIKYFYSSRYELNVRDIRCFLNSLIKEDVFKRDQVLEFGKRMFYIIYKSISENTNIEHIIKEYRQIPLTINIEIQKNLPAATQFQEKLKTSIMKVKTKIKLVNEERVKLKRFISINTQEKVNRYIQRLCNPKLKEQYRQFAFQDSDDNPKAKDYPIKRLNTKNSSFLDSFDEKFNRQALLNRSTDNIRQYISIKKQKNIRSLYYTQKFAKDSIYGTLTVNKSIQNIFKNAITQFTDPNNVRNQLKMQKKASQQVKIKQFSPKIKHSFSVGVVNDKGNIGQESIQQVNNYQEQLLLDQKNPQLGNSAAGILIINNILQKNPEITDNMQINFDQLQSYKKHGQFGQFLKEIVALVYGNNMEFKKILIFVNQLRQIHPQVGISKEWLEIYLRALNLQNKFSLNLPLKDILTCQGLFLDSEMNQQLFYLLQPNIMKHLNDQNLMKICKVITLAFKKPTLQQEILLSYVTSLCEAYQNSVYTTKDDPAELSRIKQKIKMIIQKIPVKLLYEREEIIIRALSEQQTKRQIIMLIVISLQKRFATANAGQLKSKYSKIVQGKRIR